MQNLTPEDQERLARDLKLLEEFTSIEDGIRVLMLGLALMNAVGPDVLRAAVESLGERVR
jgi:hypothetical protein